MMWMRGLWAGASLVLVLSGCSDDDKKIEGGGTFSPIITGIAADNEPAIRGLPNEFTLLVTNVNNYPITYHWSAAAGVLMDSTVQTVTWVAPDSVGTYAITASIEARDDATGTTFFRTSTFQIFVENEYARWTRSNEVQFDPEPAPASRGGVLFAQFKNIFTGQSDAYWVPMPGLGAELLTPGFYTARSPTMRADGEVIAVRARTAINDSLTIWALPGMGGNPSSGRRLFLNHGSTFPFQSEHRLIANPRFARTARWLLYNSDSLSPSSPRPWFRDVAGGSFTDFDPPDTIFIGTPPNPTIQGFVFESLWTPSWGPDVTGDGIPDSLVAQAFTFFASSSQRSIGLYKLPSSPPQNAVQQWLADSSATQPDWSPDGQHIVFADTNPTGDRDIWIIRADSKDRSTARRITRGPADDSQPRFSPDGQSIFFVSNRADRYGLNGTFPTERRGTNIWSVTRFDRP